MRWLNQTSWIDDMTIDQFRMDIIRQIIEVLNGIIFFLWQWYWIHFLSRCCRVNSRVQLHEGEDTVLEPDISVICDPDKITPRGCVGAPDWIIEIVSPSNPGHDYITKLGIYNDAGVREYWIIDTRSESIHVYGAVLRMERHRRGTFPLSIWYSFLWRNEVRRIYPGVWCWREVNLSTFTTWNLEI
mgnify:CR=1 FL=1